MAGTPRTRRCPLPATATRPSVTRPTTTNSAPSSSSSATTTTCSDGYRTADLARLARAPFHDQNARPDHRRCRGPGERAFCAVWSGGVTRPERALCVLYGALLSDVALVMVSRETRQGAMAGLRARIYCPRCGQELPLFRPGNRYPRIPVWSTPSDAELIWQCPYHGRPPFNDKAREMLAKGTLPVTRSTDAP